MNNRIVLVSKAGTETTVSGAFCESEKPFFTYLGKRYGFGWAHLIKGAFYYEL